MAKQRGAVRLKGQIGDLTFYTLNGKGFVRQSSELNKERILNDPAFRRTRENMSEFGGSAVVGKSLRMGLSEIIRSMSGKFINARVTKLMKEVNNFGSGPRGRRSFEIAANRDVFEGFEFKPDLQLASVFYAPYTVSVNGDRNEVVLDMPIFNTDSFIVPPQGATHFRIVSAITVLSDFEYHGTSKKYRAVNPTINELNSVMYSDYIPLIGETEDPVQLSNELPSAPELPSSAGLIFCLGIEFYQELAGEYYLFAGRNALRLEKVF